VPNQFNIGDKVKHKDGSTVSIAPPAPSSSPSLPSGPVVTAHILANSNRQYWVNGGFISVNVCDVSYDNTPLFSTQVVLGLTAMS
jgi:hypothetical protein